MHCGILSRAGLTTAPRIVSRHHESASHLGGLFGHLASMNGAESAPSFVQAVNSSKGGIVLASRVIWAKTSQERRRGLLGRDQLGSDEGMYIVPCEWIHTFGMRFPIDLAFIAKDGRILTIQSDLRPNRLSKPSFRAQGALELSAGRLKATGTTVGDMIEFGDI